MASFLELIDDTLGTNFHAPVYDPKKGRAKLVKVIDKAAEQHRDGRTPPTRSWKTGGDNAISFAPNINGTPVLIAGKEVNYVPAEHFQEFLKRLKAEVQAGALDKEIKAALDGETTNKLGITTSSKPKGTRTMTPQGSLNISVGGLRRGGMSDADIRKKLSGEGVEKDMIDKALAPKTKK